MSAAWQRSSLMFGVSDRYVYRKAVRPWRSLSCAADLDRTVPANCACWLKPPLTAVASLRLPLQLSTRGRDCRATQPFLTITAVIAKLAYRGASPDDDHRFPGACLRGEHSEATLAQRAELARPRHG